jgi:hypothetical protein
MYNIDKLLYTYKHRKIVTFLAKKYSKDKKLLEQLKKHDMDKLYLLLFYEKKDIEDVHRSLSSHHDNDLPKTELDYMEMVLDWESARYTKPDKPLNAYDTLYKFYPNLEKEIMPILKKWGIDYSTREFDSDVMEYTETLKDADEDDVKKELIDYIKKL